MPLYFSVFYRILKTEFYTDFDFMLDRYLPSVNQWSVDNRPVVIKKTLIIVLLLQYIILELQFGHRPSQFTRYGGEVRTFGGGVWRERWQRVSQSFVHTFVTMKLHGFSKVGIFGRQISRNCDFFFVLLIYRLHVFSMWILKNSNVQGKTTID